MPMPEPAADDVLVRVRACGVCRTDLHVVEGELPPRKTPVIPGHQIVGVIEKMGERARGSERAIASALPGSIVRAAPANTAAREKRISASAPLSPGIPMTAATPSMQRRRRRSSIPSRLRSRIWMQPRCCARASSAFARCDYRESNRTAGWACMASAPRPMWRFRWPGTGARRCTRSRATSSTAN